MSNPNPHNQFQEGNNANPNGRPKKGYSITEIMKEMLEAQPDLRKAIATKLAEKALKGDITAMKLLWQYMDGMPAQSIDLTSNGNQMNSLSNENLDKIEKMYARNSKPNSEPIQPAGSDGVAEVSLPET